MLCKICSKNISEVAGRHYNVDLFSIFNLLIFQQFCICVYIVNYLRHQTADIDRVCRRELETSLCHLFFKFFVAEQLLYSCLRIIKVSMNGNYTGIITFLGTHLQFLNLADTALWIKYNNTCSRNVSKTCHSCFSRITRCSSQDHDFFICVVFLCSSGHKMRKNGKCHVFESNGTAMIKLQEIRSVCLC